MSQRADETCAGRRFPGVRAAGPCLLAATLLAWPTGGGLAPAADEGSASVDAQTWLNVAELRGRLRLANDTLAALSTSSGQAESVLTKLRTWCGTNYSTWLSRREAVAAARTKLRLAVRKARTGPRNPALLAQLPGLRKALATAKKAESDFVAAAVGQVETLLSYSQKQLWQTVRTNPLNGEYACAAGLTAAQVKALKKAHRRLARGHAMPKTRAEHEAVEAKFREGVAGILTAAQKLAIETAKANIVLYLPGVKAAGGKILPVPEGLKGWHCLP